MSKLDLGALHVRHEQIRGVGPWIWVKADQWGWAQPAQEWDALSQAILQHARLHTTIICAGGSCGLYPRLWAEHFHNVFAFEPDPMSFHCMVVNCPDDRIIKINAALGEKPGMCEIKKGPEFNVGMHKVVNGGGPAHIPVLTLDSFNFDSLDAIQLDVEECEPKVLKGAFDTIKRHRPVISVEASVPESEELLLSWGYVEVARVGNNPDIVFAPN